jgi:hypothetical protein
VISFAVNRDTVPPLISDTLRWRDIIFDRFGNGSVGSTDTSFRQRYRRGYFYFVVDTASRQLVLKKSGSAKDSLCSFRYQQAAVGEFILSGHQRKDSLYVRIRKSNRHFQLTEKQFHWFSEANR